MNIINKKKIKILKVDHKITYLIRPIVTKFNSTD